MPLKRSLPPAPASCAAGFVFPGPCSMSTGIVTPATLHFSEPLRLQSGAQLRDYTLAYETHGTLNADGSNAVLVNGREVASGSEQMLADGDQIRMGSYTIAVSEHRSPVKVDPFEAMFGGSQSPAPGAPASLSPDRADRTRHRE